MGYAPRFQHQLGRGVLVPGRTRGSRDCGPRTWQMGVDFQTKGEKVPRITTLRRRAGKSGPKPTSIYDAKKAIDGMNVRNRKPLRYYIKSRIADVKTAVKAGKYVHVCIDYGKWNDLMRRTGDPLFRDGHSMGVLGQRTWKGEVQWLLWEPLEDHRRANIPQGPRWVPREHVVKAMEAFGGGAGRCYAGVFGGGGKR